MIRLVIAALLVPTLSLAAPKTEQDKVVYALGLAIAKDLASFALTPAEIKQLTDGLRDGLSGKPAVDLDVYGPKIGALAQERASKAAAAYLGQAAKEQGAIRTGSGLVYKDLKVGTGPHPKATDKVTVHYRGTLVSGKEFDSSYKRGQPASFALNQVIPCWTEGVQRMKVGGKARLVCPAKIAYGERGAPPEIGPGATLVFEVELQKIGE